MRFQTPNNPLGSAFAKAVFLGVMFLPENSAAQVYHWKSEDGRPVYSTTPLASDQEPAELPDVARENLSKKIETIRQETPENCDSRGGIDCSLGPDSADQSVICLDGYRNAVLQYQDACSSVRLQADLYVEFASEPTMRKFEQVFKGSRMIDQRTPVRFMVAVRNTSGVPATGVELEFNIPFIERNLSVYGPKTIAAYGSEEYSVPLEELMRGKDLFRLAAAKLNATCTNCAQVRIRK